MPSPKRPTAEKIAAVAAVYKALWLEIIGPPLTRGVDPQFNAMLLDVAGRIVLSTDAPILDPGDHFAYPEPHVHDWLSGEHAFQCACGAWEKEETLWGPDGPTIGQVITLAGTDQQVRWTGTFWTPA